MSLFERYKDDVTGLVRGTLAPERAEEVRQAAEQDPALQQAIRQAAIDEQKVDALLESWEVPEPSEGFEASFWKRFHEEKMYGQASNGRHWVFKAGAALAACLLIAVGALVFVNHDPRGTGVTDTAMTDDPADAYYDDDADVSEVEFEWNELDYLIEGRVSDARFQRRVTAHELRLLKALSDDDAFGMLDELNPGEESLLLANFDLLELLAELDLDGEDE
jgi:hypothetical protein